MWRLCTLGKSPTPCRAAGPKTGTRSSSCVYGQGSSVRCLAAAGRGRAQTNAARQAYRTAFARGGACAGDHRLLGAAALRFAEKTPMPVGRRRNCQKGRAARTAERKGIHATAGLPVGDEMKRTTSLRMAVLTYLLSYLLTWTSLTCPLTY